MQKMKLIRFSKLIKPNKMLSNQIKFKNFKLYNLALFNKKIHSINKRDYSVIVNEERFNDEEIIEIDEYEISKQKIKMNQKKNLEIFLFIVDEKLKFFGRKMDEGRFKEALMDLDSVEKEVFDSEVNGTISWYHFLRGCCNFHLDNLNDSINSFKLYSEFELMEDRRQNLIHLLSLGAILDDPEDALQWFEMCSEIDPCAVLPRYHLGMVRNLKKKKNGKIKICLKNKRFTQE